MRQLLIMLFAFNSCSLYAQTVITDSVTKNKVYFEGSIDPASLLTLGYQRQFSADFINRNIFSYTEISSAMFSLGLANSELKTGATVPVYEIGKFKIVNSLDLSVGSVKTNNFNSVKFAFADKIALGLYFNKSFFALITEYEHILSNHIEHTKYYKETYYEDAVDGWYKGGGGAFQFGIEGGLTFKKKVDTHIEIKVPFTEKFNSYGGSPFNVKIGVAYRF